MHETWDVLGGAVFVAGDDATPAGGARRSGSGGRWRAWGEGLWPNALARLSEDPPLSEDDSRAVRSPPSSRDDAPGVDEETLSRAMARAFAQPKSTRPDAHAAGSSSGDSGNAHRLGGRSFVVARSRMCPDRRVMLVRLSLPTGEPLVSESPAGARSTRRSAEARRDHRENQHTVSVHAGGEVGSPRSSRIANPFVASPFGRTPSDPSTPPRSMDVMEVMRMSTKMLSGFAKDPTKKKRTKTLHRCFRAWSAATRHAKLIETHGEKFGALLTRRRAGARLRAWSKAAARSASKRRDEARSRQLAGSARRSRFRRFVVAALRHWHWAALRRMSRRDVLSSTLDALALRGGRARVSASFARWARGASARAAARGRLSKLVRRVKTLETRRYWNAWAFVVAARREALTRTLRDHARDYEANAHRMCRRAFAHWRVVADAMVLARDADERDERRARGMFALRAKFALASAFRHWRRGAEARGERSRHAHFASVHWSRRCKWRAFRGWRRALESAAALERREDAADRLAANRRARRSIQRWRASASESARARFVRERAERMVRATRFRRLRRAWYSWRASVRPREARRVILRLERETRAALVREAEAVAAAKHFRRGDAMRRVMSGWRRYAARKAVGAERVALAERVMRRRRAGFALRAWRDESGDILSLIHI